MAALVFLTDTTWAAKLRCEFHDEGGRPLKNVEVRITPVGTEEHQFKKSEKSGEAAFTGLKPGMYELRAQLGDRMPAKREVRVDGDQTVDQTLLTQKEFDQIEKDARDAANSEDFSKAISLLEKLSADYPDDALTHQSLGLAYAGQQQEDKALAEAAKAAELDTQFAGSRDLVQAFLLRERGQSALKGQNYPAAIEAFEKWVRIQPQNAQAEYALALAYGHQGQYPQALAAIDKALELAPQNESYRKVKQILENNAGTK
jgi:tetratricopeptide (TPR) repeat protein